MPAASSAANFLLPSLGLAGMDTVHRPRSRCRGAPTSTAALRYTPTAIVLAAVSVIPVLPLRPRRPSPKKLAGGVADLNALSRHRKTSPTMAEATAMATATATSARWV